MINRIILNPAYVDKALYIAKNSGRNRVKSTEELCDEVT